MATGLSGNYDGEGPNVAAAVPGTKNNPGPVTQSPDIPDKRGTLNDGITGGQGIQGTVPVDVRGRLRVTDDGARKSATFTTGVGSGKLNEVTRWVYVSTTGNLVVRLADDSADATFATIPVGLYKLQVAEVKSSTTASGLLLF